MPSGCLLRRKLQPNQQPSHFGSMMTTTQHEANQYVAASPARKRHAPADGYQSNHQPAVTKPHFSQDGIFQLQVCESTKFVAGLSEIHERRKRFRVQARAAHQRAINLRLRHQTLDVVWLHAAPVQIRSGGKPAREKTCLAAKSPEDNGEHPRQFQGWRSCRAPIAQTGSYAKRIREKSARVNTEAIPPSNWRFSTE